MRSLSRRHDERGAVAFFMAVVMVVVLGFGALVLDIGALVQERRELQSGADAAALAVAKDCAGSLGCGAYIATAEDFADANALDYNIPLVAEGTWDLSITGVMRCGV